MKATRFILRDIVSSPAGWLASAWVVMLIFVAVFAEVVAPYDPNHADFTALLEGPSWSHPLGNDELGRDVLSRLIFATRVALIAGLQAVAIGVVLGVPIGLYVGYRGGWWDRIAMRVVDALFSIPGLVFAFAIVALLGAGLTNAMIAIGILNATRFIRLTRGVVLSVREEPFIEAARISEAPTRRVLASYLLPNIAPPLLVQASLSLAAALLAEAALSFLGIGVQPPTATWGSMLRDARTYIDEASWLPYPPGLAITLTVLAFNTWGDSLRDAVARSQSRRSTADESGSSDDVESARPVETPSSAAAAPGSPVVTAAVSPAGVTVAESDVEPMLRVRHLDVMIPSGRGRLAAVDDLSFDVFGGEILGLVGESGSGKTLTARAVSGLLPRGVVTSERSSVRLDGTELLGPDGAMSAVRGRRIGFVFQDPVAALNPALTVGFQLAEPLRLHGGMSKSEARSHSADLLASVGVVDPMSRLSDYPHQFSGGMAQRVMIAMALADSPDLLVADEPTTALDVTTQRQVLELLVEACEERSMSMLYVTHDLGTVAEVCDRAVVMYSGQAVEEAEVFTLFDRPTHPYTSLLLQCVPTFDHDEARLPTLSGTVPGPGHWPTGCRFQPRCPRAVDQCVVHTQPLEEVAVGHAIRCGVMATEAS